MISICAITKELKLLISKITHMECLCSRRSRSMSSGSRLRTVPRPGAKGGGGRSEHMSVSSNV